MIEYKASYVPSGTPHSDDPEVTIPAGWYVEGWDDENDECPDVVVHIEHAVDEVGDWRAEQTAQRIAELLNAEEAKK
jgi:hypothetical protein